jgi:succinate dehydrogenase / fumarate reductase membrane anchor subunit
MRKTVTGSHSGTGWWLAQRSSAVVMLFAGGALLAGYWLSSPIDFTTWHAVFQLTSTRLLVWLLMASLCLHAWIGLRDVLMDYVKPTGLRLALNVLFILALAMYVVWVSQILWSVNG